MIIYSEDTELFKAVKSILGTWDYYVSPVIKLEDATAKIIIETAGMRIEQLSECDVYIYGWPPDSVEYIPGACATIVGFVVPSLDVTELVEKPTTVKISVEIPELTFSASRQVQICEETEIIEDQKF